MYWIDCLPQEDFARGFGLHTPILSGESHPPKYFRFAPRALDLLRAHIHDARNDFGNIPLSEETISACRSSSSLSEIHAHIGMDFFVIVPCHSVCCPGRIIEGTRLTVHVCMIINFLYLSYFKDQFLFYEFCIHLYM